MKEVLGTFLEEKVGRRGVLKRRNDSDFISGFLEGAIRYGRFSKAKNQISH